MKKSVILIVAMLLSIAAFAQPRAIGGRLAAGLQVSYQHNIGENFAEFDLGFHYASGFGVTAMYNFILANPAWTPKGTWEVYAGPGISAGTYFNISPFAFGICGQIGLAYTFQIPLQLSLDLRPSFGMRMGSSGKMVFNTLGMIGFAPTIGIRYSFGQ